MNALVQTWLRSTRADLDRVFSGGAVRALPEGEFEGTLIVPVPGLARAIAGFIRLFVWRGKVFGRRTGREGAVVNKVTPFDSYSVRGLVRLEPSRLDGKPAIVIDYSKTSVVARFIRDELREIRPGTYLGKVWWARVRVCDFALVRIEHRG